MTLYDHLRQHSEPMPEWLARFTPGDPFPRQDFFGSRIVYYPGSGTDGQAIKVFGSTHSAHCFVYVDYMVSSEDMQNTLDFSRHTLMGYHTIDRVHLTEQDLAPNGWTPHYTPHNPNSFIHGSIEPYGFLEIVERHPLRNNDHGAKRLAILFLGADAIASYDALFCQKESILPPYAMLLQDHGFGGNWNRFGRGGAMHRIARTCGVYPEWILCGVTTDVWDGYSEVEGVDSDQGGMHHQHRALHRRMES